MSLIYEMTRPVSSRDVDGLGRCKASALMGHMQEAATLAALDGAFGREELMERYGAFWMLVRMWFHLERPLMWNETLTISTWHRGGQSALMYRDFDLHVDGVPVGEGVSGWVLASVDSRKLLKLSAVQELAGTDGGSRCKAMMLSNLKLPQNLQQLERRPMRYSDTDINAHVNNTRYADFVCDALSAQSMRPDLFLKQMQLCYIAECKPGEVLSIQGGAQDGAQYICGIDDAGKTRFSGQAIFSEDIH